MVTVKPSRAARALKAWRGDRSQQSVSRLFGSSQPVYSSWESGRVTPSARKAERIEKVTRGKAKTQDWSKR